MTTQQTVRTRFAPSPTGYVHIGSLRTALFNFLFARANKGVVVLRVEDTDQARLVDGAVENLLKVCKSVGITFDEGPSLDDQGKLESKGNHGPYIQSERQELYVKYGEQLISEGKAYYCFCTEQRLDELRKEQTALKMPPRYDRHCAKLSASEIEAKKQELAKEGKNPVVRFLIPDSGQTVVEDAIYGELKFDNKTLDDQIIIKSDGFPTYHLAVVVDDHLMEITHVIRAEEWIPSTPKHILLYQAFGWTPPTFAHIPLVLNPDKSKLSKRQGDVSVEDFLAKGYLPEALINFVAFLGFNPKTTQEVFSMEELINAFSLDKINHSSAIFDINKLDWLNGLYIRNMSLSDLVSKLKAYWQSANVDSKYLANEAFLEAIAGLEKERLKKLSEITERTEYFFATPTISKEQLVWKKSTPEATKEILAKLAEYITNTDIASDGWENSIKEFITSNSYDNGTVLWPMRYALTGLEKSPGPFEVASVLAIGLGKEEIVNRITIAANLL